MLNFYIIEWTSKIAWPRPIVHTEPSARWRSSSNRRPLDRRRDKRAHTWHGQHGRQLRSAAIANSPMITFNRKHKLKLTLHGLSYWITIFNGFWLARHRSAPAHTLAGCRTASQTPWTWLVRTTVVSRIAHRVSGKCVRRECESTRHWAHVSPRSIPNAHTSAKRSRSTVFFFFFCFNVECSVRASARLQKKRRENWDVIVITTATRCSAATNSNTHTRARTCILIHSSHSFSASTFFYTFVEIYVRFYAY